MSYTVHPQFHALCPLTLTTLLSSFSGGGPRRPDPLPDERSDEAAAAVQSQDPAAGRAQQAELHAGGRAQEAAAGQSGAAGLPTKYCACLRLNIFGYSQHSSWPSGVILTLL